MDEQLVRLCEEFKKNLDEQQGSFDARGFIDQASEQAGPGTADMVIRELAYVWIAWRCEHMVREILDLEP